MINIGLHIGVFSMYDTGRTGLDAHIEGADGIQFITDEVAKSVGSGGVDEATLDPFSCLGA